MSAPAIVTVTRDIAAPTERVFDAWLDPQQVSHFLFATPEGEIVRCEMDVRVGGRFLIIDRRANGDAEHHGQYVEIDRPRRLAFLFRGPETEEGEWSKVTVDFDDARGIGRRYPFDQSADVDAAPADIARWIASAASSGLAK